MRHEHHLVGGYVRYISPHIIIISVCSVSLVHEQAILVQYITYSNKSYHSVYPYQTTSALEMKTLNCNNNMLS